MLKLGYIGADASTAEWFEHSTDITPPPTAHPPSLRNPKEVAVDKSTDGWHEGDSKAAKKKAMQDLIEIHKRLRRQTGKPEVANTAAYPIFPSLDRWL